MTGVVRAKACPVADEVVVTPALAKVQGRGMEQVAVEAE